MNDRDERDSEQGGGRETILAVVLTLFVGGTFTVFLIFVTQGFFFYVILISAGLGLLGCFHYLLWGWAFNKSVQGEREALKRQEEAEQKAAPWRPGERRF